MFYAFFFVLLGLCLAVLAGGFVVGAAFAIALLPWWAWVPLVVAGLVGLRYALMPTLGFCFAMFVWVGIRVGTTGMRGSKVDVHSVRRVDRPSPADVARPLSGSIDEDPDEAPRPDPPDVRYVHVEFTIEPPADAWPVGHYDAMSFALSSRRWTWPTFPVREDEATTGTLVAAATVDDAGSPTPIAPDERHEGRRRLALTFRCPATLRGRAWLKFLVVRLAEVTLAEAD